MVLRGGTDASQAPPVTYLQQVLLPLLQQRLGLHAELQLVRRGFFPCGGGEIHLEVQALQPGATLPPLDFTHRGKVRYDTGLFPAVEFQPGICIPYILKPAEQK